MLILPLMRPVSTFTTLIFLSWNSPAEESALKSKLNSLQVQWSSLDAWLNFWTVVVIVGVAVELAVILVEHWHSMQDFGRGIVHPPEKPSRWILAFGLLGAGLVGIGVGGEFWMHKKAGGVETEMRNASEELVAIANRDARLAEERAAKIEASMMLRRLSKEQGDALCAAIPKSVTDQVVVTSSSQDWEAFRYAQDFNEAIGRCAVAAGLPPPGGVGNSFWSQNVFFGVRIRFTKHFTLDDPRSHDLVLNPIKRRALANAIRKALEDHGVKVEGISDDGRAMIDIYVGPKAPPPADETTKAK
jgi:hypothetical protein